MKLKHLFAKLGVAIAVISLFYGCQTTKKANVTQKTYKQKYEKTKLDRNTHTNVAIGIAVERGGKTIPFVADLLTQRKHWQHANKKLKIIAVNKGKTFSAPNQLNATSLYHRSPYKADLKFFSKLLQSDNSFDRKLAWRIAAHKPSTAIRSQIDDYISWALTKDLEKNLQDPGIAFAIQANKMKNGYNLLQQNLMATGHEAFAEVMAQMRPAQASSDFLSYLAKADYEELRQLNVKSVNIIACNIIFGHLKRYPVSISDQNFNHLFVYAVSRNQLLASMALSVLKPHMVKDRKMLAMYLARAPIWLQLAFIDSNRRQMTASARVFLETLRQTTSHEDVIDEIDTVR